MTHLRAAPTAMGLLLVLIGMVVGTGGVWLMALGGSWYYLPAGLLLVLTGLLLLQGNPAALPSHAVLLGITLAWSLWESGLNAWALAARGNVLWLLGLAMATPWFLRGLDGPVPPAARRGLAASLAVFAAVAVAALLLPGSRGADGPRQGAAIAAAVAAPLPDDMPTLSPPLHPENACSTEPAAPAKAGTRLVALGEADGSGCAAAAADPYEDATRNRLGGPGGTHAAAPEGAGGARTALAGEAFPASIGDIQSMTGADMWGLTLVDHLACRIAFERMRFDSRFALPWVRNQPRAQERPQARKDAAGMAQAANDKPPPSFLSPLGLPCQAPPWPVQANALRADAQRPPAPPLPAPRRLGTPMAAVEATGASAL